MKMAENAEEAAEEELQKQSVEEAAAAKEEENRSIQIDAEANDQAALMQNTFSKISDGNSDLTKN
jgi:hypothetical protein